MKTYLAGLQSAGTQTSYSNNGKTTLLGRVFSKSINSQTVLGPPLTQFIDVQTLAGFIPTYSYFNPTTNHLFVLGPASATPTIALFNFSNTTGAYSYVGKIIMTLANSAATTHTFRGFTVYESGGAIYTILSTTGSVAINGGTYVAWNAAVSDFTVGGTTFASATASSQKATYFLQDPSAVGVSHVATSSWGVALPQFSSSSSVNTKVWQWNGTLAASVLYSWDLSIAPTVSGTQTGASITVAAPGVVTTPSAHGFAALDPIIFTAGTVPTGLALNTVYFVVAAGLTTTSFSVSATSGGAAITTTGSAGSGVTVMRAFGTSTSQFSLRTGTLPAFTLGALLQSNSVGYAKPVSSPANAALNGQDCLYMSTTTGLYMGKISDLTSLGTTWASMTFTGINITGTGIDIVAPTVAEACYSGQASAFDVDRWVYLTNTATYVMKPYQASNITAVFGGVTNTYYETLNPVTTQMGATAISGINCMGGWIFACSSGVGQRGIVFGDMYSDSTFGTTGIISPVLSSVAGSIFKYIDTLEQLFDYTDSINYWVRSASTSTDASFNSGTLPVGSPTSNGTVSNGWTSVKIALDDSSVSVGPYFQLCITFDILTLLANTPAQVYDITYTLNPPGEQSDYITIDNDLTTQGTGSPSYGVGYLQAAYPSGTVPTLYARVYDTSGNLIFSANTSANPTSFSYSTNGGTSWTALGTIPNTVGTLIRVLVSPTPSVIAYLSFRES